MGTVHSFMPEKLVIGILIHEMSFIDRVFMEIERKFGGIDYASKTFPFIFSDYYNSEMGSPLYRSFVSIKKLYRPDTLSDIKIETNGIEENLSISGKRRVNLDPGIMALSRFVLASTKESSHRIPLKAGIYGEITLMFEKKRFRPVEWTYPDYRSEQYVSILNKIRDIYKEQLK